MARMLSLTRSLVTFVGLTTIRSLLMFKSVLISALSSTLTLSSRRPFLWTLACNELWLALLVLRIAVPRTASFALTASLRFRWLTGFGPALCRLLLMSLVAWGRMLWLFFGSGRSPRLAGLALAPLPGLLPGVGL